MAERRPSPSLEEENQITQMSQLSLSPPVETPKAIIQTGPLFIPGIHDGLIKIINQLDPASFFTFSRSCKDMNHFCYNSTGIRVSFPCEVFAKYPEDEHGKSDEPEITMWDPEEEQAIAEQDLQKLKPFVIIVKEIELEQANARVLEKVRQLLRRFPRVVVESVKPRIRIVAWNDFIQFLQEHNVKRVSSDWMSPSIPVDLLPFFLTKLDNFEYDGHIADDLIASATVKKLDLSSSRISKYTFIDLLPKFANEEITDWHIRREPYVDEDVESDPFIQACSEVMKVVKTVEIDWEKMEPSVLYNKPSNPKMFYLRQSDGSIGKLIIDRFYVSFCTLM